MAVKVEKKPGEPAEKLLQRFKKAVNKDGTLREVKRRRYYTKPSELKRLRAKERAKALRQSKMDKPSKKFREEE